MISLCVVLIILSCSSLGSSRRPRHNDRRRSTNGTGSSKGTRPSGLAPLDVADRCRRCVPVIALAGDRFDPRSPPGPTVRVPSPGRGCTVPWAPGWLRDLSTMGPTQADSSSRADSNDRAARPRSGPVPTGTFRGEFQPGWSEFVARVPALTERRACTLEPVPGPLAPNAVRTNRQQRTTARPPAESIGASHGRACIGSAWAVRFGV
jgi:hypothetical protein